MDCYQILLVSIFDVLHFIVLHLLWHDDNSYDTNSTNWSNLFLCVLWNMEPVFWIFGPKNSKCSLYFSGLKGF